MGSPRRWRTCGLTISHQRAEAVSTFRLASSSLAKRRRRGLKALPWGFAGPGGSDSVQTSSTPFARPSTSRSRRMLKKCWCTIAFSPGATSVPWAGRTPGATAPVESTPVSLTSYSIVPSW